MTDPHASNPRENPEEHIGEVIADPWEDDRQTDWATPSVPLPPAQGVPLWRPGN